MTTTLEQQEQVEVDDGAIFIGKTIDGKPVYALPADEGSGFTHAKAQERALEKSLESVHTYRVPSRPELYLLFNSIAAEGGFKENSENRANWYWAEETTAWNSAYSRRFSDGRPSTVPTCLQQSLWLVRN